MANKKNQAAQNAAARLELEAEGYPEGTIRHLEQGWNEHTARHGLAEGQSPLAPLTSSN